MHQIQFHVIKLMADILISFFEQVVIHITYR